MWKSNFSDVQNAAIHGLGLFVIGWSTMEGTLEVAIGKLLGLKPYDASIVTAGLQFKAKTLTLGSLLNRDPKSNTRAIEALNKVQNFSDRNDILHGIAGANDKGLFFLRRKSDGRLTSKIKEYDIAMLATLGHQVTSLAMQLQDALSISNEDYVNFFKEADMEANNGETSPSRSKEA